MDDTVPTWSLTKKVTFKYRGICLREVSTSAAYIYGTRPFRQIPPNKTGVRPSSTPWPWHGVPLVRHSADALSQPNAALRAELAVYIPYYYIYLVVIKGSVRRSPYVIWQAGLTGTELHICDAMRCDVAHCGLRTEDGDGETAGYDRVECLAPGGCFAAFDM